MKSRKSLLATYIKIIIVILLIAAGIYAVYRLAHKSYNEAEFETIKTDMLSIQVQTETVAQKVEIKEKGAKYIGTKIDDKLEDEKVQNLINNNIINVESKKSNLYCLDNSNLEELGLNNIKVDSFYIVDYKQNEVIYVDGIQNSNGETVYKLSDMNKKEE